MRLLEKKRYKKPKKRREKDRQREIKLKGEWECEIITEK